MAENIYESDRLVREYLLFHYGGAEEILPWSGGPRDALNFAARLVEELLDVAALPQDVRALDVGCAVGRSSFELARHCREVTGIDYSRNFVAAATKVGKEGSLAYDYVIEGDRTARALACVPDLAKPGGQLLLTTPFTWLEEYTPRENWIGGRGVASSAELLTELLSPHFELRFAIDLPFLIREHARKYQWSVAWGTRWIRK